MKLHKWKVTPKEAIQIQKKLARRIIYSPRLKKIKTIAGVDCSYKQGYTVTSIVLFKFPEMRLVKSLKVKRRTTFPYVPTLLTFREGPAVQECFRRLKTRPDLILFDGQGIAHPRKMGLATHMGILLKITSIGCAKSRLTGEFKQPKNRKGAFSYMRNNKGEVIGVALRTRKDVKPIYVSIGHMIDLKSAVKTVLACSPRYRIPEPLRAAHTLSKT